ncbi:MAG: ribosome silencing factor [Ignavibacteriales bacterium CG_4_9_14_3_um_filter_30_11]|nr:MAG: ribosome silencing factor [Ignavibacteriales bacterium CG_4_9_14_3_um_filter_30_11]
MDSKKLSKKITELIFEKKGYDVVLLNLSKHSSFADYFIICSADSTTQVKAITDEIDKKLKDKGIRCWHKEGYQTLSWVLLDYVDVVVHVFKKDAREYYNLERLWGDVPIKKIADPKLEKTNPKKVKT